MCCHATELRLRLTHCGHCNHITIVVDSYRKGGYRQPWRNFKVYCSPRSAFESAGGGRPRLNYLREAAPRIAVSTIILLAYHLDPSSLPLPLFWRPLSPWRLLPTSASIRLGGGGNGRRSLRNSGWAMNFAVGCRRVNARTVVAPFFAMKTQRSGPGRHGATRRCSVSGGKPVNI